MATEQEERRHGGRVPIGGLVPLEEYFAISPSGHKIKISRKLFEALRDLIDSEQKHDGTIEVGIHNGGVSNVIVRRVYK